MFGRKTEEEKAREHAEKMRELEEKGLMYYTEYLGGLKRYPLKQHAKIYIYPDRIELKPMNLVIPYTKLRDIANVEGDTKVSFDRAMLVGWAALAWKKKRLNTVLEYTDELGEVQTVVVDFCENVRYIQPRIYEHMMRAKEATSAFPALS